jgi:hypothetical protein
MRCLRSSLLPTLMSPIATITFTIAALILLIVGALYLTR